MKKQKKIVGFATMLLVFTSMIGFADTDPSNVNTNYTVNRDSTTIFTADGINTGTTEYGSTELIDLTGNDFMEAKVFIKRFRDPVTGDEELRIYFSVHDTTDNSFDRIDFIFDRQHNHGNLGNLPSMQEDVLLRVTRSDCLLCSFQRIGRDGFGLFSGAGSAVNISNSQIMQNSVGEYTGADPGLQSGWTGEFVLTPADLDWGYFPAVVGVVLRARSTGPNAITNADGLGGGNPVATYPLVGVNTVDETDADHWANLKLRYPIDYALVMDFSGSMLALDSLADNRWVRAKRAADLFVAALGLFKNDFLDDKVSASQYSWSCSDSTPGGNTTGSIQGGVAATLVDIPVPPTGTDSFTSGNTDDPAGNNCTPIKEGIDYGINTQLGFPGVDAKRDRMILLLSDGFHNTPPGDVPLTPSTDTDIATWKDFAQVRTVAMGPDGSAGTNLLSDISTEFSGALAFEAKYNNAITFEELLNAYLESLQDPLTVNVVDDLGGYSPGAPDKLVFIGVWNNAASATNLTVQRDSDTPIVGTISNTKIGYAAVVVDQPISGGTWQVTTGAPDNVFVLADLRVRAQFLVDQKSYGAGEPILLEVKLKDMAKPILGAETSVELARPGEGLGNFLSTIQRDCSFSYPDIPQIDNDPIGVVAGRSNLRSASSTTTTADPLTGRYAAAADHFNRCNKAGLERQALPGISLFDDGTSGDKLANDGTYSLLFEDTSLEGTYSYRFHVRGSTDDGIKFSRTRTISQYVRIKPETDDSQISILPISTVGNLQTSLFYFVPQDALGNYYGPGLVHTIKYNIDNGSLLGSLVDLNNGIYAQRFSYDLNQGRPVITPVIDGQVLEPIDVLGRRKEIVPFIGYTGFDSKLKLDDSLTLGVRLNYRFSEQIFLGGELAVTPTEDSTNDSGTVVQLFANVRYDPAAWKIGHWQPYLGAGIGYVFFDFVDSDEAFATQISAGLTYDVKPDFGIRLEARSLNIQSVYGLGSTTNGQANLGLVFRF